MFRTCFLPIGWEVRSNYIVGLWQLVLINVAFFGTGNMASVASFEISSVYRFITIFDVSISINKILL